MTAVIFKTFFLLLVADLLLWGFICQLSIQNWKELWKHTPEEELVRYGGEDGARRFVRDLSIGFTTVLLIGLLIAVYLQEVRWVIAFITLGRIGPILFVTKWARWHEA